MHQSWCCSVSAVHPNGVAPLSGISQLPPPPSAPLASYSASWGTGLHGRERVTCQRDALRYRTMEVTEPVTRIFHLEDSLEVNSENSLCSSVGVVNNPLSVLEMSAATWQSDTGSNKHLQSRRANQQFTQYYNEAAHTTSGLLH